MKNLIAFFLVLSIFGFSCIAIKDYDFHDVSGKVTFVANIQQKYPSSVNVIESGEKSYITANLNQFDFLQNNLNEIYGYTLCFDNLSFEQFIKQYNVKILKTEQVQNQTVTYGYSDKFNRHIFIDNKMVNVQIVHGEYLKVGIPAILDSF